MPVPEDIPETMTETRAGAFVTLKKNENLRGCIGTTGPTRDNLAMEIIANAVSAGLHDPRFPAVSEKELPQLTVGVDVLGKPETIESEDDLDPDRYGVIVRKGSRSGLLLPDLEGVDTPRKQIDIALRKAGISRSEKYELMRFKVTRHE
jgi:AmmeMemoRadiSam system protein A